MIYMPNFSDSRVIAFCTDAGFTPDVDGFYKALKALGFTGSIDEMWAAYLLDKYGSFKGLHVNAYEDDSLFEFFRVSDPTVPSAGTASTTAYNLGASGATAHGNVMRYSIYDSDENGLIDGTYDYPTNVKSYEGYQPFNANIVQRSFGTGDPTTGANLYDNLYFMRFTSMPTLSSTFSQGILSFSVGAVLSGESVYTPLRIRAIKTAPTWPTATNGQFSAETSPIGYGNYTTNYVDWAPEFWNADYSAWAGTFPLVVRVDVTHVMKELIGTAGGAGTYIFVFETLSTLDGAGATPTQFRMTSAATAMPTLSITTGNDERKAQLKTPTNAEVVYYIPFDRTDATDSSTAISNWRIISGNQEWKWSRAGINNVVTGTMAASSYGVEVTAMVPELSDNQARKLIAPFDVSLSDWYARINVKNNDLMLIVQHKQKGLGGSGSWLWDLANDTGFVCDLRDGSGVAAYRLRAGPVGDVSNPVETDIPINDTVGAVKTLVGLHIAATGQWYFGYHNADKWYWKTGPVNSSNVTNQSISGIAFGGGVYQGVAAIEFTTARTLNEYKQLAHDMRVYWSNNFKGLPENL